MEGEPSSIPLKLASFTQSLHQRCELWAHAGGRFYFCFQGTAISVSQGTGWVGGGGPNHWEKSSPLPYTVGVPFQKALSLPLAFCICKPRFVY